MSRIITFDQINRNKFRKLIMAVAVSLGAVALGVCTPIKAQAASDKVFQTAGVASFFENSLSIEEMIQAAKDAEGAYWGYTNIGIAHVESGNLNVRQTPSTSGKLVGKMRKNSACEILEIQDGWAHITSGEVEGYVSMDYLLTGVDAIMAAEDLVQTVAVALVDGLNVRSQPSTDANVITQVPEGEEMEYEETNNGWVKILIDDATCYVASEYVEVRERLETAITMSELLYGEGVSDVRVDLVEYAKQFLGNPYVWGGTSLTKGCDCSGFVLSIYKHFGVTLAHYSGTQAKSGTKITYSEIKPGDLIFYGNSSGNINHVAIYIGGGQVIHASSPSTGIKISKYNYRTPLRYVRILKD